jgi:hypothetical protein
MGGSSKEPITKERAEIYEIIFGMLMKLILILSGLVTFFIILYHLIKEPDTNNKIVFGTMELILSGTLYKAYTHYFPRHHKDPK